MDSVDSDFFKYFKNLLVKGLMAIQKNINYVIFVVKTMRYNSTFPCFEKFNFNEFINRFKIEYDEEEMRGYVEDLVELSVNNKRTAWYDDFQKMTNDIEP